MAEKIKRIVDKARDEKGGFFLARLSLRVSFSIAEAANVPDDDANMKALMEACRQLGFDPDKPAS